MLAENALHVPWLALYLIDDASGRAWMAGWVGPRDESLLLPACVDLRHPGEQSSLGEGEPLKGEVKAAAEAAFAEVIRTRRPTALTVAHTSDVVPAGDDRPPVHVTRVLVYAMNAARPVTGLVVIELPSDATVDDARVFANLEAGHLGSINAQAAGGNEHASIWSKSERARAEGALRDSEERLKLVVDSAKDYAIFAIGVDGLIQSWNAGAERVFGWTETEAVGVHARMIFTPEDRARGAAEEEMRQAEQCGRAEDERWHLRRDGGRFYASGVLVPLKRGGLLTGYAKIARDLTERKQLEDALLRAQDELEQRVRDRTVGAGPDK